MEFETVFPSSKTVGAPAPGNLMLFQYTAKYKDTLPFYDRNPLCYIVGVESQAFYGVNLHYTLPRNRLPVLRFIDDGGDFSKLNGYNKYLKSYVRETFTSLVGSDMEKAIEMRLEDFVRNLGGISVDIDPKLKSFYRR